MKLLAFLGPQEIIILLNLFIVGFAIYLIIKLFKRVKSTGGTSRLKGIKWFLIILIFLVTVFLAALDIHPLVNLLLFAGCVGSVIGIAKYKPEESHSDKPTKL